MAKLQQDVNMLLAILTEHSIPAPQGVVSESPHLGGLDSCVELNTLSNPIAARVGLRVPPRSESSSGHAARFASTIPGSESASPILSSIVYTSDVSDSAASSRHYIQPTLFQDPRVGIDFVLAYVLFIDSHLCIHVLTIY